MSTNTGAGARFAGRPCVGLDVHQRTCTATSLDPGGREREQREFETPRRGLEEYVRRLPAGAAVALEASTSGKAVCGALRSGGVEVYMASPRKLRAITDSGVKTDKRDSAHLAHLLQSDYFPRSYLPPPEIDRIRTLVRFRMSLGRDAGRIKNRAHALVVRNLLQDRMEPYIDWLGRSGLKAPVALPLGDDDRFELRSLMEQLKVIVDQEEGIEREMAELGKERRDVQLLMTIPGVNYYAAMGIVGEVGDVRRYPTMNHLASDAGMVPRADNSGEKVSTHRKVKPGNMILKYFLLCSVNGMLNCREETSMTRFYRRKAKQIGTMKARIAAGRKLARVVWQVLTTDQPYVEQQQRLTARKSAQMRADAKRPTRQVTDEDLSALAGELGARQATVGRLMEGEQI